MQVLLLIGTRKGGFIATSDLARCAWTIRGPFLKGCEVNHLGWIPDTRSIVLAGKSAWWGPAVQLSHDLGETWREPVSPIRFAEGRGHSVERIWAIKPDRRVPGRVYAGVDPGALFVSDDGGERWREVLSLTEHPTRAKWMPGAGGLMVHSMAFPAGHPSRIIVGLSAAGVFRSDDGGDTWLPKNAGVRAPIFSRTDFRKSASAFITSKATRRHLTFCISRTIAASIAATMPATPGWISPMDCRRGLDSRSLCFRTGATRSSSCPRRAIRCA